MITAIRHRQYGDRVLDIMVASYPHVTRQRELIAQMERHFQIVRYDNITLDRSSVSTLKSKLRQSGRLVKAK